MSFRRTLSQTQSLLYASLRARTCKHTVVQYSQQTPPKKASEDVNFDEPVQFSSSKAAQFNTEENIQGRGRTNRAKYEPLIVKISLAAFLIYFLALREESDWDEQIGLSLYERIPDMEIIMLRNKKKMASSPGAEPFTEADKRRLEELERQM